MSEVQEKKTRTPIEHAVYPAEPKRVAAIDKEYIQDYLRDKFKSGETSRKELVMWQSRYRECVAAKDKFGERAYFQDYRKEFVNAFFPKLKNASRSLTMEEFFNELLGE